MSKTLTFYSVSAPQVAALKKKYAANVEGDVLKGRTPLGDVEMTYSYAEGSGQLTITVEHKPFLLVMGTIEMHVKDALANAQVEIDAAALKPVAAHSKPATEPATSTPHVESTAPAVTQAKKAEPKKTEAAH